ncbi:MAG TPA: glycosyltransferase family 2 protein [Thermoanaerobaculia bacterium]|nr:glycosyltransferase family 2 protein [Thermoanaerobaculia bacterium]
MSPPFQLPDVDCVVVNRDGGEPFFTALSSIRSQEGVDVSILVVDNASQAPEVERVRRDFPEVRLVPFPRNLGFAGAADEGIARGRSPFLLLVNNDAVLPPDYAARLASKLAMDERLGAVQGLVVTADGRKVDTAGLEWNARGEAVPVLAGRPPEEVPADVFEVSGVSATAALYRRAALESVAPHGEVFDRSFFAYYEDVDLSLRLARAGWRFACDPAAVCHHEGSRTGRRTPARRALWTARNRWRTLFRNFDSRLLARSLFALLRADLAHVRQLGWKGALLPFLVWPRLPVLAWRARQQQALLSDWPGRAGS